MPLDDAEEADGRETPAGRQGSGLPRPGKTAVRLVGRPAREKIINSEDLLNLRIALQSTGSVEEFLTKGNL